MTKLHRILVLAFALSVILPVTTVELFTTGQIRESSRAAFIHSVNGEVRQIDTTFSLLFEQVEKDVRYLSGLRPIRDALGNMPRYLASPAGRMVDPATFGAEAAGLYDLFLEFVNGRPDVAYVYLGDDEGGYLQWPLGAITEGYDPQVRPWYQAALGADGNPKLTNAYYWAADDAVTFSMVKKITHPDSGAIGVLGIDLSPDRLMSLMMQAGYGKTGYLMIVEDNLNILADARHPDNHFKQLGSVYGGAFEGIAALREGNVDLSIDGTDYLASIYTSPALGWRFISLVEAEEINAAGDEQVRLTLLVTVISLVVFLLLATVLSSSIATRIATHHKLLNRARKEAEQASEAKSNFLSTISHEIRTPLNGILGMAELLHESDLDSEQRAHTKTILSSGKTLLAIINDVLDMSKIESGALELEETRFNLRDIVSGTLTPFAQQAEAKGITLQSRPVPDVVDELIGDPVRLRQILWNLLSNAVKFTSRGGVTVSVGAASEEWRGDTVMLEFKVEDTGVGISSDRLQQIFDPFSQEDNSITRKYGGTGLGLAIIKKIVDLMNGTITVDSSAGSGSCFTVTLPFRRAPRLDNSGRAEAEKGNASASPSQLSGLHILVAEDNPVNAMIIRKVLERAGCRVTHTEDGAKAVAAFTSEVPDLVFMDVHMPDMDGVAATRAIRALEHGTDTPIIGLTADVFEDNHRKFRESGMTEVITKPFTADKLRATIARYTAA
jgi:signal transduction histidine kinase/CheY-like chemotaxis protein